MSVELSAITKMVKQKTDLENEIEELEQDLKDKKDELSNITDKVIPEFMSELEIDSIKLKDGRTVSIKKIVRGHIAKERAKKAFQWLRDRDCGDIIKTQVGTDLGKAPDEEVLSFAKIIQEAGYTPTLKQSVHHSTLNKFCRERLEAGEELDLELFGVYTGETAIVK